MVTWSMLLGVGREGGETERRKWSRGGRGKEEREIRREGQRTKSRVDVGRAWFGLD